MTIWDWRWPTRWPPSKNGARQVECTINGIGERAGNAALEELAAVLYVRADRYHLTFSINLGQIYPTSQILGQIITFRPRQQGCGGRQRFCPRVGIHQHGMLANPLCYEIMTPALVGVAKTHLVLASTPAARRCGTGSNSWALPSPAMSCNTLLPLCALADRKRTSTTMI